MKYVAIVKQEAVRDRQVCCDENYEDVFSDGWRDLFLAAYVGIYEKEPIEDIREKAAAYAGTVPENILLIPV